MPRFAGGGGAARKCGGDVRRILCIQGSGRLCSYSSTGWRTRNRTCDRILALLACNKAPSTPGSWIACLSSTSWRLPRFSDTMTAKSLWAITGGNYRVLKLWETVSTKIAIARRSPRLSNLFTLALPCRTIGSMIPCMRHKPFRITVLSDRLWHYISVMPPQVELPEYRQPLQSSFTCHLIRIPSSKIYVQHRACDSVNTATANVRAKRNHTNSTLSWWQKIELRHNRTSCDTSSKLQLAEKRIWHQANSTSEQLKTPQNFTNSTHSKEKIELSAHQLRRLHRRSNWQEKEKKKSDITQPLASQQLKAKQNFEKKKFGTIKPPVTSLMLQLTEQNRKEEEEEVTSIQFNLTIEELKITIRNKGSGASSGPTLYHSWPLPLPAPYESRSAFGLPIQPICYAKLWRDSNTLYTPNASGCWIFFFSSEATSAWVRTDEFDPAVPACTWRCQICCVS